MGVEADVEKAKAAADVLDTPMAGGLVIRGGVLRIAGYAAGVGLSVAAAAILIRALGASDYGRYVTVISLVTIVASLAEAGMTNLGIREYSTLEGAERDRLMRNLLGLRLAMATAGVVIAVGFALVAGYTAVMVAGAAAAGLGLVLLNVQSAYSVPLASRLALGRVTALELIRQGATLALTAALVAAGAGLFGYLSITVPVSALVVVLSAAWVRGLIPLRPAADRAGWMALLRLSASFAVATAFGTVYVYVIVIVMSLVASNREVGYFGASFRVFIVLGGIAGLLVGSAFPVLARAARDDRTRLAYATQRLFDVSVLVGAWMALCTVAGASVAIDVLAGPGFGPAAATLQIQGAALLASFLLATWGFVLISLHRHRELLLANGLALTLSITMSLLLVPTQGAEGGAVATVVSEAGLAGAYLLFLVRGHPELRPRLGVAAKAAVATGVAAAAALLPPVPDLVALVIAATTYLVVALVLRAVPDELVVAARERLRAS